MQYAPTKLIYVIFTCIIIISHVYSYKHLHKLENTYKDLNKQSIELQGVILSTKEEKEYYDIYEIKVINSNKYKNTKLLLYVKKDKKPKILNLGDRINIIGEISLPQTARNEYGFDYAKYLYGKEIHATIKCTYRQINIISHNNVNFIYQCIMQQRNKAKQNIQKILPSETAAVASAIILRI